MAARCCWRGCWPVASRSARGGRGEEVDLLLREIQGRLDPDAQPGDAFHHRLDAPRELAVERAARGADGRLAAGGDQVGHGLGLRQVEPPFEERAFGEFARPRPPRAERDATGQ